MAQSTYPGSSSSSSNRDRFGHQADRAVDKASDQLRNAADAAEGMANRVMGQGREMTEGVSQVAGNFKTAVDRSLKDQPMATLAVAAMVGFVLGAIWKS